MPYLTLLVALAISAVAAYYSIVGLVAIFAASAIPIIVMGSVLEVGKLITASWLYRNWLTAPKLLLGYFITAVAVLMLITSMGIYGFLSKAHIDQGIGAGDATARIERLEQRITQEQKNIDRSEQQLAQLDEAIAKYNELGAVSKGVKAREDQKPERDAIQTIVNDSYKKIDEYNGQIADLKTEVRAFEVEVGPVKYIAELFGSSDLEGAVRYVILCLIFVFDPLAVLLVIAANMEFKRREVKEDSTIKTMSTEKAFIKTKFKEVEIDGVNVEKNPITDEIEFNSAKLKSYQSDSL